MEPNSADNPNAYLIEQIRTGSQAAWKELIDSYSGRLLAFARARTQSLADAEDLVQETFIGFLQSATHFDPTRSLETYLFTILRYKLYDLLRSKKMKLVSEPADAEDWWDRIVPGTEETPSGLAVQAEATGEQEKLLGEVLRELIHDMRDREAFTDLQVIELIFFGGRRNIEIGELLEIDQKAVAGIKFRAIQKLQKFLGQRDSSDLSCLDESQADITVARVWREQRLTCLKRSTLGSLSLGVLDEPWKSYTQFHLDIVACPMCVANLADIESEEDDPNSPDFDADRERMFQSSVGFLKKSSIR
jgi:RNA polymerase sigma-70 factor, ECF subfamily